MSAAAPLVLPRFMARQATFPFTYGRHDCCLWLADWMVALGRPDPAHDLRGRYSTRRGCARILRKYGGVLDVVALCAARAGLRRLEPGEAARMGDVGVIEVITDEGRAPCGAICTGPRWVVRAPNGLLAGEAAPLVAWSVT